MLTFRVFAMATSFSAYLDRALQPVHHWVWSDFDRRVRKLIAFGEVEGDGGRDILRAAELTADPLLRRLYLAHAIDELHHADLFRKRSAALLRSRRAHSSGLFNATPLPGGHGLDDLKIDGEPDHRLLAFLHVAEKAAAGRFAIYRDVVNDDPLTQAIFDKILRDEVFHMRAGEPLVEALSAHRRGVGGDRWRRHADASILHSRAAIRVAGQTRGTAREVGVGADSTRSRRIGDEPILT
jgi:hypothetical protein